MRLPQLLLGGAIVVLLALGVAAVVTGVGDLADDGRGEAVVRDAEADGSNDPAAADRPDTPGANPAPEAGEEAATGDGQTPAAENDSRPAPQAGATGRQSGVGQETGSVSAPDQRRVALDQAATRQRPADTEPSAALPHTGGATPPVWSATLLGAGALLAAVRFRLTR